MLPGVRRLLETLDARADVFAALLTGNCEEGARIKLEHFDIWKFFRCGAYGDDVTDRNHLFDVAVQRAEACGAPRVPPEDVVVVGRHGARCGVRPGRGRAFGGGRDRPFRCGHASRKSGADLVMRDLSDTEGFLRLLGVQT